ncbi:MAG: Retron-type reverse transcriptase [Gammaproteobacteria bacterium]|nr:MAG: Retron-type reverse transcriptase [Pseudomonadota bacterium]PIE38690.1 MAG: Retron-type reverse transcriptase [Gammaproteobacteria bacterium]
MTTIIHQMLCPQNLDRAWNWFRNDKTVWQPGVRRAEMERHKLQHILSLRDDLEKNRFTPGPIRRFELTRADGKTRQLTALTLRDKLAQRALLQILTPILEPRFHTDSFGFRPGRNIQMAAGRARTIISEGHPYLVHTDVYHFFDQIPLGKLKKHIKQTLRDKPTCHLINKWLDAHKTQGTLLAKSRGIPQGAILSPILGNLYLNSLDWQLHKAGIPFVRYADDILLLAKTESSMHSSFNRLTIELKKLDLVTHPDKTIKGKVSHRHKFLGQSLCSARRR